MSQSNDRPLCNTCHRRPVAPSLLKKYRAPRYHLCSHCWRVIPFNQRQRTWEKRRKWETAWEQTSRARARNQRARDKPEAKEHKQWLKRSQRSFKRLQETRF